MKHDAQANMMPIAQVARMTGIGADQALELAMYHHLPFISTPDGLFIAAIDLTAWLAAARHAGKCPDGDV